jgi:hypothetical protein
MIANALNSWQARVKGRMGIKYAFISFKPVTKTVKKKHIYVTITMKTDVTVSWPQINDMFNTTSLVQYLFVIQNEEILSENFKFSGFF